MKYILRVATPEQYCYIEQHFDGEATEAVEEYRRLTALVKGGAGLLDKEWRETLDAYPLGNGTTPETHERMNEKQAWMIHELDKMFARQKYKDLPKDTIHHSLQTNS